MSHRCIAFNAGQVQLFDTADSHGLSIVIAQDGKTWLFFSAKALLDMGFSPLFL
jgi:hypothetical protein